MKTLLRILLALLASVFCVAAQKLQIERIRVVWNSESVNANYCAFRVAVLEIVMPMLEKHEGDWLLILIELPEYPHQVIVDVIRFTNAKKPGDKGEVILTKHYDFGSGKPQKIASNLALKLRSDLEAKISALRNSR
ncbi:MAG: hypothetical protein Q8R08_02700 [bacterium]|nr:hypothetical protein [bacterium]